MPWSGKLLGGLFGGMMGGPVGAGVGAAIGHYLADSDGAQRLRSPAVAVDRLEWQHHAFSASGPGMILTPVWRARGLVGRGVAVTVEGASFRHRMVIEPEHPHEECHLPEVTVPYAILPDGAAGEVPVEVRADARGDGRDAATFSVPLPSPVRRLGLSGPARVVMALVASARAGGRPLVREDVRFIRERFATAHPLDDDGQQWLRAWIRTLRDADPARLTPEKCARRLAPHVDADAAGRVVTWLMHGARGVWPGEAQVQWVEAFAFALGLDAAAIHTLWGTVDRPVDEAARAEALATLGVPPTATPEEIRDAWRALVRAGHPDHARDPEEAAARTQRTAAVNAAYDVLTR